jgi:hypothetical protein
MNSDIYSFSTLNSAAHAALHGLGFILYLSGDQDKKPWQS